MQSKPGVAGSIQGVGGTGSGGWSSSLLWRSGMDLREAAERRGRRAREGWWAEVGEGVEEADLLLPTVDEEGKGARDMGAKDLEGESRGEVEVEVDGLRMEGEVERQWVKRRAEGGEMAEGPRTRGESEGGGGCSSGGEHAGEGGSRIKQEGVETGLLMRGDGDARGLGQDDRAALAGLGDRDSPA